MKWYIPYNIDYFSKGVFFIEFLAQFILFLSKRMNIKEWKLIRESQ